MLAKTSEKLELIDSLRETLSQKEIQVKELSDKLLQTEHSVRTQALLFLSGTKASPQPSAFMFGFVLTAGKRDEETQQFGEAVL